MEKVPSQSDKLISNSRVQNKADIFQAFKPYEQLLLECSEVLNELCTSIWLYNLPIYNNQPQKTILRFRAKQKTQQIPFVTLAAFKHHIENITRLGKLIFLLRKIQISIKKLRDEVDKLPSIFQWEGGILELASEIASHEEDVQLCGKTMGRLGALTYRLQPNDTNDQSSFEVRSLVNVDQTEINCELEANKRYTVVDNDNPFLWKLRETGQMVPSIFLEASSSEAEKRFFNRIQQQLNEFKAICVSRIRAELIENIEKMEEFPKRQDAIGQNLPKKVINTNTFEKPRIPRDQLFFPKRVGSSAETAKSPPPVMNVTVIPLSIKLEIVKWLQDEKTNILFWKPFDEFRNWLLAQTGQISAQLENINQGLIFIRMMHYSDYNVLSEDGEESGFTEIDETAISNYKEHVNRSFSWSAKMETVTDVNQRYEWKGNIHHKLRTSIASKDPRVLPTSGPAAAAKQFVWELTNRTVPTRDRPAGEEGQNN